MLLVKPSIQHWVYDTNTRSFWKKTSLKPFALWLTLILQLGTYAQQKTEISGRITDLESQAIAEATVLIVEATSNQIIKATFSDENGNFTFNDINSTAFKIEILLDGTKQFTSEVFARAESVLKLPPFKIQKTANQLNEVLITTQKNFVTQKADRIVVDPNALISNTGLTAFEVLEKSPSVNIGFNNAISIRGKNGVVVMINNKPSNLSADDLANYLKSIPATDIAKIEIMNNPPAQYDAAGNAGIINIILKKNNAKGTNGNINSSYGQGTFARLNSSFNLNYRIDKWNFFGNLNVSKNKSYQDLTITRTYFSPAGNLSSEFIQNSLITPDSRNNSIRLGTDFYATAKTTFGIVWSGFSNPSNRNTSNIATVYDSNRRLESIIRSNNPMRVDFKNSNFNLNMTHKINQTGPEITANLDYVTYDSDIAQSLINQTFNPDNNLINETQLLSKLPSTIKIRTANVDYTGINLKNGKLDLGAKSSFVDTRNVADFQDVANGVTNPNYEFSNDFTYRENINAIYLNFNKDFKKIAIQLGLRLENTRVKGYQAGNPVVADSTFQVKYTNLFPTLFLQYRVDSIQKHVVGISAGRRINRPNYKDLNPFTYPIDRFTFYGGNPFLKPTFSYNLDLSHTYKNFLTTTLMYSYTVDEISETNEQRGNIYYSRPGNFDRQISYGLAINGLLKLRNWWTLNIYTSLINNTFKSKVYTESLDDSAWNFTVVPTNQFQLSKAWAAELSGQYQSSLLSGQFFIGPVGSMRIGVSRKILDEKGSLKLAVSDVFYTNQINGQIRNIANANASWYSEFDSRVVTFSFSYRFTQGKNLKVRQSGASQEEQNRVKT